MREAVEPIGRERERHDGKKQVERVDRQRAFGRVEHLVEPGAAEEAAEERIDGIAGMHISPQVPAAADRDCGRDVDERQAEPTEAVDRSITGGLRSKVRSAIAGASKRTEDERRILDAQRRGRRTSLP